MKKSLSLMWRFKWIPLLTLIIESMVILPVLILLMKFGESEFAYNSLITPFGSSEFLGLLVDAIKNNSGFMNGFNLFLYLIPITVIVKLMLTAGTMNSLQQGEMTVSLWLAGGAQHIVKSLALLLRWVIFPIIWCGLCALLLKLKISWVSHIAIGLMILGWFLAFSWFYFSLIIVVRNEKKSLRKGLKNLWANKLGSIGAIIIFLVLLVLVNLMSLLAIQFDLNSNFYLTLLLAFFSALMIRVVVFYWQSNHLVMTLRY